MYRVTTDNTGTKGSGETCFVVSHGIYLRFIRVFRQTAIRIRIPTITSFMVLDGWTISSSRCATWVRAVCLHVTQTMFWCKWKHERILQVFMTPNAACVIVFGTYTKQRPSITLLQSGEAVWLLVSVFGNEIENSKPPLPPPPKKYIYMYMYILNLFWGVIKFL